MCTEKINNLFYYATSELSQDAFICWLMSFAYGSGKVFANYMEDDKKLLRKCAQELLYEFGKEEFEKNGDTAGDLYLKEKPKRQEANIDVLLQVAGKKDKYIVIIEDKTFTSEHGNQLEKYATYVDQKQDYTGCTPIKVYYKLSLQSNKEVVTKKGYHFFGLEEIATYLEKYKGKISNNIFSDYCERVLEYKADKDKFKTKTVGEWSEAQIEGFYDYFQNNKGIAKSNALTVDYGHVSNQSGGFYAMWTEGVQLNSNGLNFKLYLQCEFIPIKDKSEFNIYVRAGSDSRKIKKIEREDIKAKGTPEGFDSCQSREGKTVRLWKWSDPNISSQGYQYCEATIAKAIEALQKFVDKCQ